MEELNAAIFSDLTTSAENAPFIEKIPYFVLIERTNASNDTKEKNSENMLEEFKQKIKFREQDLSVITKQHVALKYFDLSLGCPFKI